MLGDYPIPAVPTSPPVQGDQADRRRIWHHSWLGDDPLSSTTTDLRGCSCCRLPFSPGSGSGGTIQSLLSPHLLQESGGDHSQLTRLRLCGCIKDHPRLQLFCIHLLLRPLTLPENLFLQRGKVVLGVVLGGGYTPS